MANVLNSLIKNLQRRLDELGHSPSWLAEKTGISNSIFSRLLSGERGVSLENAVTIAHAVDWTISDLVGDQNPEHQASWVHDDTTKELIEAMRRNFPILTQAPVADPGAATEAEEKIRKLTMLFGSDGLQVLLDCKKLEALVALKVIKAPLDFAYLSQESDTSIAQTLHHAKDQSPQGKKKVR